MNKNMQVLISTLSQVKGAGSLKALQVSGENYIAQRKRVHQFGRENFPDAKERAQEKLEARSFVRRPRISILVPLYNTPEKYLREMLQSVFDQTYENWELCLADGSDQETDLEAIIGRERKKAGVPAEKIRYQRLDENRGISDNTNACIDLATGEYLAPFDHDDLLHPSVLYWYVREINARGADFLYCDEATFQNDDLDDLVTVHLKPDYARDNLRANNYICHLSCFQRRLIEADRAKGWEKIRYRSAFNGSQDHDLILRVTRRARNVVHVARVLYYWRSHAGSTASDLGEKNYAVDAARLAVEDSLKAEGFTGFTVESSRAARNIFRISYALTKDPKVSVIIPGGTKEDEQRIQKSSPAPAEVILCSPGPEAMNEAAGKAQGTALVFLSPGLTPVKENWLAEMLMYAQREDVGAVGGEILYHRRVQGAGVLLGIGPDETAEVFCRDWPHSGVGYMGRLCYAQNLSAVSADCMMLRREVFAAAGGFDTKYQEAFYDLDLCLRLKKAGKVNVFTPYALLNRRTEKKTAVNAKDRKRFQSAWEPLQDPYYNPNFSREDAVFTYSESRLL